MPTETPLHPDLVSLSPEELALIKPPTKEEIEEALKRGWEEAEAGRRLLYNSHVVRR